MSENLHIKKFLEEQDEFFNHISKNPNKEVFDICKKFINSNQKIIEYGIGGGHLINFFKNNIRVKDYVGLDLNENCINVCKHQFHKYRFYNLIEVNFNDILNYEKGDVFVSFSTIQQFPNENYLRLFFNTINNYDFDILIFNTRFSSNNIFKNNYDDRAVFMKNNFINHNFVTNCLNNYSLKWKSDVFSGTNYCYYVFTKKGNDILNVDIPKPIVKHNFPHKITSFFKFIFDNAGYDNFFINYLGKIIHPVDILGNINTRICVVGNSPKALKKQMGDTINQFDKVIRINDFVIKGYERFIGTKSDIWVTGASIQTQILKREFDGTIITMINSPNINYEERNNVCKKRLKINKPFIHFCNSILLQACKVKLGEKLTTGTLVLLCLILLGYKNITIYGIELDYSYTSQRYFSSRKLYIDHDLELDKLVLKYILTNYNIYKL